ncbi:MAG: hypothetical protein ACI9Z9_002942, partial [Litorivivens sp.]
DDTVPRSLTRKLQYALSRPNTGQLASQRWLVRKGDDGKSAFPT